MKNKRLTEKGDNGTYEPIIGNCENCFDCDSQLRKADNKIERKLGKLEDTEEALGITLDILIKAMKNGFFVKTDGFIYKEIEFVNWPMFMMDEGVPTIGQYSFDGMYLDVLTKDYGKTWALTKEELTKKAGS